MNGGYCMIDFTGINMAASEAQTKPGIYQKVYDCMALNKPLMLNNALNASGLYTPVPAVALLGENQITLNTVIGKTVTIANNDSITIE